MADRNSQLRELVKAFQDLEVDDPTSWAQSALDGGSPQLAICMFLTLANSPIDRLTHPKALRGMLQSVATRPVVDALGRLLSTSSAEDVLQVVRWSLRAYLVELCFLLDDTAAMRFPAHSSSQMLETTHWELFRTNETGQPDAPMCGLHEVVSDFFAGKD